MVSVYSSGCALPKVKGKGLGLFLVKELVSKMKWEIRIKSEYGKGTTIFLIKRNARLLHKIH